MPTKIETWSCDVCLQQYTSEDNAVACEARGVEELPSWLFVGAKVFGFGENGCESADFGEPFIVTDINTNHDSGDIHSYLYSTAKHQPIIYINESMSVSHNQSHYRHFQAYVFDPMRGWDYLRYASEYSAHSAHKEAKKWVAACDLYGITPDVSQAKWLQEHNAAKNMIAENIKNIYKYRSE